MRTMKKEEEEKWEIEPQTGSCKAERKREIWNQTKRTTRAVGVSMPRAHPQQHHPHYYDYDYYSELVHNDHLSASASASGSGGAWQNWWWVTLSSLRLKDEPKTKTKTTRTRTRMKTKKEQKKSYSFP
jgi:hypothetical protein